MGTQETIELLERDTPAFSQGRTLLIVMTPNQERMLARYGRIVGCDATYKTMMWGLPFFLLCVVNAQGEAYPAAYFWMSSETKEAIAEVLVLIKSLVPEWNPEVFIVDKSSAEMGAIKVVFPNVHIVLCDFHAKQAWHRWLTDTKNNVGDLEERRKAYKLLAAIADSTSIDAAEEALQAWEHYVED